MRWGINKMTTATENLEELITLLPGYDPYAQAGDCVFDEDEAATVIEFVEIGCTAEVQA